MDEFDQIYTEITTKKYRTYSPAVEATMLKFVNLGAEVVKCKQVKQLLVGYKIICQNTQLPSIQRVFEEAIKAAKTKLDSLSCKQDLIKMEDLDVPFSDCCPQVEHMRYAWEILKTMLDVLKNNNKFEDLFLIVAQAAFQFCIDYDRKAEFRRLGDFMRSSLNTMIKSSASVASGSNKSYFAINLVEIESSKVQLEVRMLQLSTSVQLNCWVEAYRIMDDLQSLFNVAKKSLPAECLLRYFVLVSTVLSVSPDATYQLLACASLLKALGIVVGNGLCHQSRQQVSELCDKILVSFLCIPVFLPSARLEEDERMQKILSFLGISFLPTREQLKREIVEIRGSFISQFASNQILLEYVSEKKRADSQLVSLVPLPSQSFIQANISSVKASELLSNNSIGTILALSELRNCFPEFSHSSLALEKFLIACCINLFNVQPLIDQECGKFTVVKDLNLFLLSNPLMEPVSSADAVLLMPSLAEFKEERTEKLGRCKRIEELKEKKEQQEAQREKEAYRQLTERLAIEQEVEKARLQEEVRKREVERLKREKEIIERDELKKLIDEFMCKAKESGKKYSITLADCPTKKDFVEKQVQYLKQEVQELETKSTQIAKRLEYTERAIRKEGNSILAAKQAAYLKDRTEKEDSIVQSRFEKSSAKFNHILQQKERIAPFISVFAEFKARVEDKHRAEEAEKEALLQEQEQKRQEELRLKALAERPLHMQQHEPITLEKIAKPFAHKKQELSEEPAKSEISVPSPFAARAQEQSIPQPFAARTQPIPQPGPFAARTQEAAIPQPFAARTQETAISPSATVPAFRTTPSSVPTAPISSTPFTMKPKFQPDDKMASLFAERMAASTGVISTTPTQEVTKSLAQEETKSAKPAAYKFVPKSIVVASPVATPAQIPPITSSFTNSSTKSKPDIPTPFRKQ